MNMSISTVVSNKGNDKLIIDGFSFHLARKTKKSYNWVCSQQKKNSCNARVLTRVINEKHEIIKAPSVHSHAPITHEKTIWETNQIVKTKAKNCDIPPSRIITDAIVDTPSISRVYLPSKESQKNKIQRARAHKTTKEPNSLEEINIPEEIRYTEGELFVLAEDCCEGEKIILLGTKSSLTLLAECSCWIMDGTFDVVPSIMRQLFSIHGNVEGEIVPLVFCIMSKKSRKCYDQLFFELKKICLQYELSLKPQKILCDFEKAIVSSAKAFFPESTFKGCQFHFGQIIWRKVQKSKLAAKYGNSEEFSLKIRMIKSLSFVPSDEVANYYLNLSSTFEDNDVKTIGSWFKKNYIGDLNVRPKYNPKFWTVGNAAETGTECFPRTQNSVEAWHRRLKVVVGKRHAGLYKLIKDLSSELIVAKHRVEKIRNGEQQPKKKQIITKNKRIKKIIRNRSSYGTIDFLKRIAQNTILN